MSTTLFASVADVFSLAALGFLFWTSGLMLAFVFACVLLYAEKPWRATTLVGATLVAFLVFKWGTVTGWLGAHPRAGWGLLAGYVLCAIAWAGVEIRDLLVEMHERLMEIRGRWLARTYPDRFGTKTRENARILEGDDELPDDLKLAWTLYVRGDKTKPERTTQERTRFTGASVEVPNPEYYGDPEAQRYARIPTWGEIKGQVSLWACYWPFYFGIWFFDTFLRKFWERIVAFFRKQYEQVIAYYYHFIDRDFVPLPTPEPKPEPTPEV